MEDIKSNTSPGWRAKAVAFLLTPKAVRFSIIFAICLCVPSVWMGLFGDDHYHRVRFVAPDLMPAKTDLSIFGLFTIANGTKTNLSELVSHGLMPWYAQEDFRFQPWRPLAELSHALDYWLWPTQSWLMHLHQLVWILAFFLAVKAWYRHLFPHATALAAFATVLVVLDANMAQTHYWLAGRNTLIAATFSLICLLNFSRSAQKPSTIQFLVAIASYATALFSSELALGTSAFLFSYVCFMQTGGLSRFLRLAPFFVISLIWLICYKAGHQGVAGSDWYFDPVGEPAAFLQTLLYRFPKAVFQQLFILPLEIFGKVAVGSVAWIGGIIILLLISIAIKSQLGSNTQRFLVVGALLSSIPLCAGPGIPRVLLLVSVGVLPLLAELCLRYFTNETLNIGQRCLVWVFLVLHTLGALAMPLIGYVYSVSDAINIQAPARELAVTESDTNKQWINLNASSAMQAMLYPLVRGGEKLPLPKNWYLSGAGLGLTDVTLTSDTSLEISSDTAFLPSPVDYFVRKKATQFELNRTLDFDGMRVTVLGLTADQRPQKVRLEFDRTLDDANTVFFACQGDKLVRLNREALAAGSKLQCGL